MKTHKILFLFITILFFNSCINDWDKYLDTKILDYTIKKSSSNFDKNTKTHIEKYNNTLTLKFHIKPLVKIAKTDSNNRVYKKFVVRFYDKTGKIITIDDDFRDIFSGRYDFKNKKIALKSNKKDITKTVDLKVEIPLIYFYKIKHGKRNLNFFIGIDNDENSDNNVNYFANISFDVNIPEIYKTTICNDSIILQNDKEFSPKGMDFSFRKGLPDIYWYISYKIDDNTKEYVNSNNEASYAVMYNYKDTLSFYHYKDKNKISIFVMDRDVLSPDDIIGYWDGKIEDLQQKNNEYKILKFKHIDKFKIKVIENSEIVN